MKELKKKTSDQFTPHPHHPIPISELLSVYHRQNWTLKFLLNHTWLSWWRITAHCCFPDPVFAIGPLPYFQNGWFESVLHRGFLGFGVGAEFHFPP